MNMQRDQPVGFTVPASISAVRLARISLQCERRLGTREPDTEIDGCKHFQQDRKEGTLRPGLEAGSSARVEYDLARSMRPLL